MSDPKSQTQITIEELVELLFEIDANMTASLDSQSDYQHWKGEKETARSMLIMLINKI